MYMDFSSAKISNGWLAFGLWGSLCIRWAEEGPKAFVEGVAAGTVILALMLFLYRCSMIGAADIKLFSVMGIYFGLTDIFQIGFLAFAFAFIISIIKIFYSHQYLDRFRYFFHYLKKCCYYRKIEPYYDFEVKLPGTWIHFSFPLWLAVTLKLQIV